MTPLEPALEAVSGPTAGDPPPGRRATWTHALILPGDERAADVLFLVGRGERPGESAFALFVDEDGDAALSTTDVIEAAREAAAGRLPAELMLVVGPGASVGSYPRTPGDLALGRVRVAGETPDRAARLHELVGERWEARETSGAWLSTAYVPLDGRAHARIRAALRRFLLER
jgi:hypothetical protein